MNTNKDINVINSQGDVVKRRIGMKQKEKQTQNKTLYSVAYDLGFYLAAPLIAGVFLGLFLDNRLHTKPIFILIFIILGSISSIYNLIRLTK